MGAGGVRRGGHAPRALHTHLAARHRPLQQVSNVKGFYLHYFSVVSKVVFNSIRTVGRAIDCSPSMRMNDITKKVFIFLYWPESH